MDPGPALVDERRLKNCSLTTLLSSKSCRSDAIHANSEQRRTLGRRKKISACRSESAAGQCLAVAPPGRPGFAALLLRLPCARRPRSSLTGSRAPPQSQGGRRRRGGAHELPPPPPHTGAIEPGAKAKKRRRSRQVAKKPEEGKQAEQRAAGLALAGSGNGVSGAAGAGKRWRVCLSFSSLCGARSPPSRSQAEGPCSLARSPGGREAAAGSDGAAAGVSPSGEKEGDPVPPAPLPEAAAE